MRTKAQDDVDRRKFPRVHTDSVVSISRIDTPSTLGHALDVSLGGIRFQCVGVELELGDVVSVMMTLGDETLEIKGRLVRVTDLDAFTQEVALGFTELDPAVLEVLKEHLPEDYEFDPRDQ
jgi:hypothetical protein